MCEIMEDTKNLINLDDQISMVRTEFCKQLGTGYSPIQWWAKEGLQFYVHKTQSLFLYPYVLIIILLSIQTTLNPLLPHPAYY